MKIVSIILIVLYLILPVACLAHPCSSLGELVHKDTCEYLTTDQDHECPVNHDADDCETTCCCAGQILADIVSKIISQVIIERTSLYEPQLALPRLLDRIFVPPQNLA